MYFVCAGFGGGIREEMLLPDSKGLRNADYMAIGISAGLLGILYVAGLAAYMCFRRRRRRMDESRIKLTATGTPAHEAGIMRMNPLLMNNQGGMMQVRNSHPHMDSYGELRTGTTTMFQVAILPHSGRIISTHYDLICRTGKDVTLPWCIHPDTISSIRRFPEAGSEVKDATTAPEGIPE